MPAFLASFWLFTYHQNIFFSFPLFAFAPKQVKIRLHELMRKCSVYTRDIMTSVRNPVLWSFRCPFRWNHQVWPLHCVSAVIKPLLHGEDFFYLTMDSPENQEKVYLTAAQGENGAITLEVSIFDLVWLSTHNNRRRQTWSWIAHWFRNAAVDESALCNISLH